MVEEVRNAPSSKVGSDAFLIRRVDLGVRQVDEPLSVASHPAWRGTRRSESKVCCARRQSLSGKRV